MLPEYINDKEVSDLISSSQGYRELIYWGATRFLDNFGLKLQRHFRITHTALKDQAAQNLVQELGSRENQLKQEIERLQEENEQLKENQKELRDRAFQEALCQIAQKLQNRPQPVLNQIFSYLRILQNLSESQEGELSLSSREALGVLITFEELINTLKDLNIEYYPKKIEETFYLKQDQLGEYNYIEGSPFQGNEDTKKVRCTTPGWCVGKEIITPACVKEVE